MSVQSTDRNVHELEWNFERPLALPGPSRYNLEVIGLTRSELDRLKVLLNRLEEERR